MIPLVTVILYSEDPTNLGDGRIGRPWCYEGHCAGRSVVGHHWLLEKKKKNLIKKNGNEDKTRGHRDRKDN